MISASSPGLDYVWRDSSTYNIVLSTLGIDSRVVVSTYQKIASIKNEQKSKETFSLQLDGPGWLGQVRQAATLLTPGLLTPVPAAARQEKVLPSSYMHPSVPVPKYLSFFRKEAKWRLRIPSPPQVNQY